MDIRMMFSLIDERKKNLKSKAERTCFGWPWLNRRDLALVRCNLMV